jgi:hypothetical protein
MGGAFGHTPAAAAWTKTTALARERHQSIQPALVTAKAREPGRQAAASKKIAELLLDEPRQPCAVSERRSLGS